MKLSSLFLGLFYLDLVLTGIAFLFIFFPKGAY